MLPRLQVLLEAADKFACTYEDKEAMAARARVLAALQVGALYIVLLHGVYLVLDLYQPGEGPSKPVSTTPLLFQCYYLKVVKK